MASGLTYDQAWLKCGVNLVTTARSHCFYFMLAQFKEQAELGMQTDPHVGLALNQLLALYACSQILDGQQWLGILSTNEAHLVNEAVSFLLEQLRPNAVTLMDAFEFPDRVLNSCIGRYDGNVYEALYQTAKE